jgi:hypothetical protein
VLSANAKDVVNAESIMQERWKSTSYNAYIYGSKVLEAENAVDCSMNKIRNSDKDALLKTFKALFLS